MKRYGLFLVFSFLFLLGCQSEPCQAMIDYASGCFSEGPYAIPEDGSPLIDPGLCVRDEREATCVLSCSCLQLRYNGAPVYHDGVCDC